MRRNRMLTAGIALAAASVALTGCSQDGGTDFKVGYSVNVGSHEWYQNVVKGAEETAKEKGIGFQWSDANTDLSKQITQTENMLTKGVDVLAVSPVDPKGLSSVMSEAEAQNTPVVTESNTVEGATTTVGIKNLDAAKMLGEWAGKYQKEKMKTKAKVLIVGQPTQVDTRDRVAGFKQGLTASGADVEIVREVDGGGLKDTAVKVATDAITARKDINMIFGINDDSALGGTQAYQEAGLPMGKLATFGFGVEGRAGKSALTDGGPYKAGLAMFPEFVGRRLIEQAQAVHDDKKVEERTITPAAVLTADNLATYYTRSGNDWKINYAAVEKIVAR